MHNELNEMIVGSTSGRASAVQHHGRLRIHDLALAFFHADSESQYKDYHDITRGGQHVKAPKAKAAPRAELHPLTDEQLECQVLQHAAAVHCVQLFSKQYI